MDKYTAELFMDYAEAEQGSPTATNTFFLLLAIAQATLDEAGDK